MQDWNRANCSITGFHLFPNFVQNKTGFAGSSHRTLMSPHAKVEVSQAPSQLKCNGTKWAPPHMHDRSWHHQAQLSPLHIVMHFGSLTLWQRTTGRVSCHHLHPSMNNVWTGKMHERQKTLTPVENNERSGLLYPCGLWVDLHIFQMIFKAELSFSGLTLPPILLQPLSTTSCH